MRNGTREPRTRHGGRAIGRPRYQLLRTTQLPSARLAAHVRRVPVRLRGHKAL